MFKLKHNDAGDVTRYKARLMAQGFSQKFGIDYDEVFAPVVRQTTVRALLTKAGCEKWKVKHFDAKTAFLNDELQEIIYRVSQNSWTRNAQCDYPCQKK